MMKIRLFPNSKEKETLNTWFGMSRYVYNQSLISLKILTENNPLNNFYDVTENPFKVNIDIKDNGDVNLNINFNPLLCPKENKCRFIITMGKNKGKECSKNCGNYDFCFNHSKKKLSPKCKFVLSSGKNCGNSRLCLNHSNGNSKCRIIMKSGKNKGKECGRNCGDSEFCSLHSKFIEKSEHAGKGENNCSYKFGRGRNKDKICGKKCEGEFCELT